MKRFFACLLLGSTLVLTGQGCGGGSSSGSLERVELEIWRVFDEDDTFEEIISAYRTMHPNVSIDYRQLRFEEYEEELIRAFAEGRGPDIYTLHNTWLQEYKGLIEPMPDTVTTTFQETQGSLRKEVVVVERTSKTMSVKELKANFVEQVATDVLFDYQPDEDIDPEEKIHGLPMSMDTLALYYNRDLLDAAGIATVPETWEQFQEAVIALTDYDDNGNIRQSGAALGTSQNVERASDIVSLLMMQNGAPMLDERGRVTFDKVTLDTPDGVYPSFDATTFYTDFANPTKEVFTWNEDFSSSFEAFANGETAFFLGYSYHLPLLKTTAPKLNFAVSNVPQIDTDPGVRQVNFANYWVETVARAAEEPDWAWDFILFATDEENVSSYLQAAQRPTALRGLIDEQLDDEYLGPFAEQALTAESWYRGLDVDAMEEAMEDLIDIVLVGTDDPTGVMRDTVSSIKQTY